MDGPSRVILGDRIPNDLYHEDNESNDDDDEEEEPQGDDEEGEENCDSDKENDSYEIWISDGNDETLL